MIDRGMYLVFILGAVTFLWLAGVSIFDDGRRK